MKLFKRYTLMMLAAGWLIPEFFRISQNAGWGWIAFILGLAIYCDFFKD